MNAVDKWATQTEFTIQRHQLESVIREMVGFGRRLSALTLIRHVYREEDEGYGTLEHAKEILRMIEYQQ